MAKFNCVLINPTNVVLNLRAMAKKKGYLCGSSIAQHTKWQERKIRRMLSGFQDIKTEELSQLAKVFGLAPHHFLKDHEIFLEHINLTMDGDTIRREVEPMIDTEKIRDYEMLFFVRKSGVPVLTNGMGYAVETILFSGTEDRSADFFEELSLRYDEQIKVEIGILKCEGITIQEYTKERMDILKALELKVQEIWAQYNPDLADIWGSNEFSIYHSSADRFARILPKKEYELLINLKNEIFPHKLGVTNEE